MTTDNQYYKQIAEKLTGETISGVHTNNYYLNKICTSLGYTYSGVTCNGTYIKDFARHFTEQTYTKIHFNNYFLKKLAEHLTGETYGNHDDNYFLGLINENIIPQPPSFTSVEVTSDKSILSYTDSEAATLTAQLKNGDASASVSGETVEFYKYVDGTNDVLLGSGVTDSNGEATYSYSSQGVGDIQVYAKVRTLVSKTFTIEDCHYYNGNTLTSTTSFNLALPSDNYSISFKVKRPSSSGNNALIQLNDDSRIVALVGQVGGAGVNQMRCYTSTSNFSDYGISNTPLNSEVELVFTKQGTSFTYSMGESSTSMNCTQTFAKLYNVSAVGGNYVKELKVKPL